MNLGKLILTFIFGNVCSIFMIEKSQDRLGKKNWYNNTIINLKIFFKNEVVFFTQNTFDNPIY